MGCSLSVPSKSSNPTALDRPMKLVGQALPPHCSHEQSPADHPSIPLSPTTPYTKRAKAFIDRDTVPSLSNLTSNTNSILYIHTHTNTTSCIIKTHLQHKQSVAVSVVVVKIMEGVKSYDCGIDNLKATELRLGLPGAEDAAESPTRGIKRSNDQDIAPVAKAQAVGWPPVRSYRMNNSFRVKADTGGMYVKVSMDGTPYLRKIDLKVYQGYNELSEGLRNLFKSLSLGELSGCSDSDYATTYKDKDGDWMLVGDVPWGMFINSCERLRIMRGTEARGLDSNQ